MHEEEVIHFREAISENGNFIVVSIGEEGKFEIGFNGPRGALIWALAGAIQEVMRVESDDA